MLNNANLEIARKFVWTMSRLKVNYFPTQASLYRAIETIKFPHLNRSLDNFERNRCHQLSDWRLSVSPYNNTKNVYAPNNYHSIVQFLIDAGLLKVYYTWYKGQLINRNVKRRAYIANFDISGIRSEIGELGFSPERWNFSEELSREYHGWSGHVSLPRARTCMWYLRNFEQDAQLFAIMEIINNRINAHKKARKVRKRASRKPVVETKFVESSYEYDFAAGHGQSPQSVVLPLTMEELQELYYLVGIGAMCGQLSNKSVADGLINKVSALICSK